MNTVARGLILVLFFCCTGIANASGGYSRDHNNEAHSSNIVSRSYRAKHRQSERLLAAIKPLYADQLLFSVVGDKIFMRGNNDISAQAIVVLQEMDQPERYFRLRLSEINPELTIKRYSTNQPMISHGQTFSMTNNKPLLISRRNETQQLNAGGVLWYQTDTLVNKAQTIEVSVRALTADRAQLTYRISVVKQRDQQVQANTAVIPLNQWVPLLTAESDQRFNKTMMNKTPVRGLFIKLETY